MDIPTHCAQQRSKTPLRETTVTSNIRDTREEYGIIHITETAIPPPQPVVEKLENKKPSSIKPIPQLVGRECFGLQDVYFYWDEKR